MGGMTDIWTILGGVTHIWNKVIRPKSPALVLSKKVWQTDRQTMFFQKDDWNGHLVRKDSFLPLRDIKKVFKKPFEQFCCGRTDERTDGQKKWLIVS